MLLSHTEALLSQQISYKLNRLKFSLISLKIKEFKFFTKFLMIFSFQEW